MIGAATVHEGPPTREQAVSRGWIRSRARATIAVAALVFVAEAAFAAAPAEWAELVLHEPSGVARTWGELTAGQNWTVVVFVGAECPLVRKYVPRLNELRARFDSPEVGWLAVASNSQDSLADLAGWARATQCRLTLVKDPDARLADRLGAERTPEAFVLDSAGRVHYRGRIDDQFGQDFNRPRPNREDLTLAVESLVAGRAVELPNTPAIGCRIGRLRAPIAEAEVTWCRDVAPVFARRCQNCHRAGEFAPFALTDYAEVRGWAETIGEVVRERRMPPWHDSGPPGEFANDPRLTDDELALIERWVAGGAPEGDPAELPAPPEFSDDWQLGEPDQVVYMSEEPFAVPATGVVPYQWFEVDPGWTEDRWIRSAECRPGNRGVVHHVAVYVWPPGKDWYLALNDRIGLLSLFQPGQRPQLGAWDETAFYVPAGSRLRFEMHYTANGAAQTDRSCVGLRFAEPGTVRRQLSTIMIAQPRLEIPPGAREHRVEARYTLDEDTLVYGVGPHMHLRGRAFRIEAQASPAGTRQTLLDVPAYDFKWQVEYRMSEPRRLPAGTEIVCTAWYDNSAENANNPDPTVTVRWGEQIWEEMMLGCLWTTPAEQDLLAGRGPPPRVIGRRHHWRWWGAAVLGGLLALVAGVRRGWRLWSGAAAR